jgi:hypothetical protein
VLGESEFNKVVLKKLEENPETRRNQAQGWKGKECRGQFSSDAASNNTIMAPHPLHDEKASEYVW